MDDDLRKKLDDEIAAIAWERRWSPEKTVECPVEDLLRGGWCESDEQLRTRILAEKLP